MSDFLATVAQYAGKGFSGNVGQTIFGVTTDNTVYMAGRPCSFAHMPVGFERQSQFDHIHKLFSPSVTPAPSVAGIALLFGDFPQNSELVNASRKRVAW